MPLMMARNNPGGGGGGSGSESGDSLKNVNKLADFLKGHLTSQTGQETAEAIRCRSDYIIGLVPRGWVQTIHVAHSTQARS